MRIQTTILNPVSPFTTLTGSGTATQVAVFSGANTIASSTALTISGTTVTIGVASTGLTHTWNGDILFGSTNASDTTDIYRGSGSGALSIQGDNTATPSAISIFGTTHASLASIIRFTSANVTSGSISALGVWTIGPSASAGTHIMNGAELALTTSVSTASFLFYRTVTTGSIQLLAGTGSASASYKLYGSAHATKPGWHEFENNAGVILEFNADMNAKFNGQIYSAQDTETGMTGTTHTINWNDANSTVLDLQGFSGNVTVTLTNPMAGASYLIKVIQSSTARTITWSPTIKWPGGVAPTISVANDAIDVIVLYYDGSGYLGTFHQAMA